jgi:hypothetical protein
MVNRPCLLFSHIILTNKEYRRCELSELSLDFQYLMKMIGFKANTVIEEICQWYINQLK